MLQNNKHFPIKQTLQKTRLASDNFYLTKSCCQIVSDFLDPCILTLTEELRQLLRRNVTVLLIVQTRLLGTPLPQRCGQGFLETLLY